MNKSSFAKFFLQFAAWAIFACFAASAQNTVTVSKVDEVTSEEKNLPATLKMKTGEHSVIITGREGDNVFYTMKGSTAGRISANVHDIEAADFGIKEYDDTSLRKALRKQAWQEAANILLPVVDPALPYLDLKENNAVSLALDAGEYLMKAAAVKSKGYLTKEAKELGREQYLEACRTLKAVGRAEWFSGSESAQLRSILCLIFLGKTDLAEKELKEAREPDRWDAAYGLYWMAKAHLNFAATQFRSAINDIVQSLIFETKNIDTFPDAILLSARCYEEMLEWHRARDVYYEVAKLFSGTYWQDFAVNRLQYIMAEGLTKSGEVVEVENVFFGIDEDVNAKATLLLDSIKGEKKK